MSVLLPFSIAGFLILTTPLILVFFAARSIENNHEKDLIRRETALQDMRISNLELDPRVRPSDVFLISSAVVLSPHFMMVFGARVRTFFGGNIKSYESILERARREVILRLKEKACVNHADEVIHLRFEYSSGLIHGKRNKSRAVHVLAYATAVRR